MSIVTTGVAVSGGVEVRQSGQGSKQVVLLDSSLTESSSDYDAVSQLDRTRLTEIELLTSDVSTMDYVLYTYWVLYNVKPYEEEESVLESSSVEVALRHPPMSSKPVGDLQLEWVRLFCWRLCVSSQPAAVRATQLSSRVAEWPQPPQAKGPSWVWSTLAAGRSGREQGRGEPSADNTSTDLRIEESIPPVTSNTAIFTEVEIRIETKPDWKAWVWWKLLTFSYLWLSLVTIPYLWLPFLTLHYISLPLVTFP